MPVSGPRKRGSVVSSPHVCFFVCKTATPSPRLCVPSTYLLLYGTLYKEAGTPGYARTNDPSLLLAMHPCETRLYTVTGTVLGMVLAPLRAVWIFPLLPSTPSVRSVPTCTSSACSTLRESWHRWRGHDSAVGCWLQGKEGRGTWGNEVCARVVNFTMHDVPYQVRRDAAVAMS